VSTCFGIFFTVRFGNASLRAERRAQHEQACAPADLVAQVLELLVLEVAVVT
jgi:hypothetical protein